MIWIISVEILTDLLNEFKRRKVLFERSPYFIQLINRKIADCKRDRFEIKSPFCILWTGPRRISSTQSSWLSLKQTTLLTFLKIQTRRYNRSNHDLPWIKILYSLAICMRIKILSYSYNYLSNVTNTDVDIGEKNGP